MLRMCFTTKERAMNSFCGGCMHKWTQRNKWVSEALMWLVLQLWCCQVR